MKRHRHPDVGPKRRKFKSDMAQDSARWATNGSPEEIAVQAFARGYRAGSDPEPRAKNYLDPIVFARDYTEWSRRNGKPNIAEAMNACAFPRYTATAPDGSPTVYDYRSSRAAFDGNGEGEDR